MTLAEAAVNKFLVIEIPGLDPRGIDRLETQDDGIIFLDIWWSEDDAGHPMHKIEGNISGTGPWKVGETIIRELDEDKDDPELVYNFSEWVLFKISDKGKKQAPDTLAKRLIDSIK